LLGEDGRRNGHIKTLRDFKQRMRGIGKIIKKTKNNKIKT
jgi:hypothetical protein